MRLVKVFKTINKAMKVPKNSARKMYVHIGLHEPELYAPMSFRNRIRSVHAAWSRGNQFILPRWQHHLRQAPRALRGLHASVPCDPSFSGPSREVPNLS